MKIKGSGPNHSDLCQRILPAQFSAIGLVGISLLAFLLAWVTARECHVNFMWHHSGITVSFTPSLLFGIATWYWWGGIVVALWFCAQRRPALLHFSFGRGLLHLGIAGLLGVLHLILLQQTVHWDSTHWPAWGALYSGLYLFTLRRYGLELVIYDFIYVFSCLFYSQLQTQKMAFQKLLVEQQLSHAQFQALQMQMEPHFLFNTLNAITSLVSQHKNEEVMQTLAHLNAILRTTLQRRSREKVLFTEELQLVESYLAIQKVRYADRIEIDIQATSEARRGLVPSFLLQPLVENAVRHGVESKKTGGRIETRAEKLGDKLWMRVRDNGNGISSARMQGHGIGLSNIKERLAFFYPNAHQFEIESPSGGGYQVTIQIPFEEAPICN